ncbi:MAG: hypothetical protein JW829_19795 [Pirellulales bacterium]|nr:hypothetical protein [Pirellulales bacterium]
MKKSSNRFLRKSMDWLLFGSLCYCPIFCSAQDPAIRHCDYQIDDPPLFSGYETPVPFRLFGIVLNNTEDWLDPLEQFDNQGELPPFMGGEAEIFVQAVDLDGTPYDPYPDISQAGASDPLVGDFGGTFVWMGQNYGNLPNFQYEENFYINQDMIGQPGESRPAWYAELDRLGFWRPGSPLAEWKLVRAGDLVEVRAAVPGLTYQGKHNVNERHTVDPFNNFEVEIREKGYGLPEPESLHLNALKDEADQAFFDQTRQTGGEHYQGSRIQIQDVLFNGLSAGDPLSSDTTLTVSDATGRSLDVYLGLSASFNSGTVPAGPIQLTGVLDQKSTNGRDGYRLLVMNMADIQPVLSADFDSNGHVDGTDFLTWQTGFGVDTSGDANGDGTTDDADLAIWQQQFGSGSGQKYAVIPEPTAACLSCALLSLLFLFSLANRSIHEPAGIGRL